MPSGQPAGRRRYAYSQSLFPSDTLHTPMHLRQGLFLFLAISCCVAQNVKPVADRVAAQNALFDEQCESDLRNFPGRATAFGDYRYNDKLAERSLAAIVQYHKIRELRDRAQKELGSKFDIRTFHDEMLDGGTLPLDLLEARTDKWIAEQKAGSGASGFHAK